MESGERFGSFLTRELSERFWGKVFKTETCWIWMACCLPTGYGKFGIGSKKDGSRGTIGAHRMAWMLEYGEIPDGMWVLHRCDHPWCVRPNHLWLGTVKDNMRDASEKGRVRIPHYRGEKNHKAKLTVADVITIRKSSARTSKLVRAFGISDVQVNNIRSRRSWSHV
jgi:hypothetical protein